MNPRAASSVIKGSIVLALSSVLLSCATPVGEVDRWPISGVEVAQFEGEVVDILCEVSGNCEEQCGSGTRQLGIKAESFGTVLVSKNLGIYTGAAEELWQHCAKQVEVNGLFTQTGNVRVFQVQNIREPGGRWQSATSFHDVWAKRNNSTVGAAERWYRQDSRVKKVLEKDGRLGLGLDADKAFFDN